MSERSCERCGSKNPAGETVCVECGAVLPTSAGDNRARAMVVAIVMLELGAMFAVSSFVAPRMAQFAGTASGSRSELMRLVFAPWWMNAWMAVVVVLGGVAIYVASNRIVRAIVLTLCLLAGLVPIVGSTMGIYSAAFEAASEGEHR